MRSNGVDPPNYALVVLHLQKPQEQQLGLNPLEISQSLGLSVTEVRIILRNLEAREIVVRNGDPRSGLPRYELKVKETTVS